MTVFMMSQMPIATQLTVQQLADNDTIVRRQLELSRIAQAIAPLLYAAECAAKGFEPALLYQSVDPIERLHFAAAAERAVIDVALPLCVARAEAEATSYAMHQIAREYDVNLTPLAEDIAREAIAYAFGERASQLNRSLARVEGGIQ